MKQWIKKNKTVVIRLSILVFLIFIWVLLGILKNSRDFCEDYSRGFGRVITVCFAAVTKYFPISLTEILFICAVVGVIISIVLSIKKIKAKDFWYPLRRVLDISILVFSIISLLSVTTQPQYNRKAVPIPLYQEKVEKTEFLTIINHFLDDYNECAEHLNFKDYGEIIPSHSIPELNVILEKEYKRLNDPRFGGYFTSFTTYCKPLMSSEFFSQQQVTGISIGCFGEANINTAAPACGIPFTMVHEMAHMKGVMREDDANLVALYLTLTSEDYYVRYSGYFYSFARLMSLASLTGNEEDYAKVYYSLNPNIIKQYKYNNDYWDSHDWLSKFQDWINDWYLKSSGTEGTSSYDDTKTEYDEETEVVISFSTYQKLYFALYYNI